MKTTWSAGVLIGVLCGLWMLVMGYSGWYKDPVMLNMFWMVILIQIGCLVWGLRKTAGEGKQYWGQVGQGTLMSLIGAAIIFVVSLLFTTVLFPNYFAELKAIQEEMLRNAGKSQAEISATLDAGAAMQTPIANALSGVIGTIMTGFVCSLIIGAFVRNKGGSVEAKA
jgi:hypothetical protein